MPNRLLAEDLAEPSPGHSPPPVQHLMCPLIYNPAVPRGDHVEVDLVSAIGSFSIGLFALTLPLFIFDIILYKVHFY